MTIDKVSYLTLRPATGALDGELQRGGPIDTHCAHPYNNDRSTPAEWWADLGHLHKIYNITIYGRTDCEIICFFHIIGRT